MQINSRIFLAGMSSHSCCKDCHTPRAAAYYGHSECLRFHLERDCSDTYGVIYWIFFNGKVDNLKYVHSKGCSWPELRLLSGCLPALSLLARRGHLECLQYLYECCGNEVIWEDSGLENFEKDATIPESIKVYLRGVADSWKNGENRTVNLKPAKH